MYLLFDVHVRARNVGANSLNVVSRTFPHFLLNMVYVGILTPMVMSHSFGLVVETHFYDTI